VNKEAGECPKRFWGLLRRRSCWVPTLRGCAVFLFIAVLLAFVGVRFVHPFLAINAPVRGGVLVVEGWAPDYALGAVVVEFNVHRYTKIFVTGGPVEQGGPLSEYESYAELGAAALVKLGVHSNVVQAVPAPWVAQDRTFASAAALKKWLSKNGGVPARMNLVTIGPHARRSRLLFRKAFGKGPSVGVIAVPVRDYNPSRWWRSSPGVRTVTGEVIGYGYARFLFRKPKE
jgi:hypothetical protein